MKISGAFRDHLESEYREMLPFSVRAVGTTELCPGEEDFYPGERNPFVELIWCASGGGEVELYEKTFPLAPGDAFLYLEREDHLFRAGRERFRFHWLCLDGPLAESVVRGCRTPRLIHTDICPEKEFQALAAAFRNTDGPRNTLRATAIALELLGILTARHRAAPDQSDRFTRALDFIKNHASDPALGMEQLAEAMQTPLSTLNRIFRSRNFQSPARYLREIRNANAAALLTGSRLAVTEIARRCGYSGSAAFIRMFRRLNGVTPMEYRNMNSKQKSAQNP